MNLNMIRPRNETEDFLLSITKNCEKFIKQKFTKPQETIEFKLTKQRETFSFKPSNSIEWSWMSGLTILEIYNSIFNITKENNKLEHYTDTFDEFSVAELKDEPEEILDISEITPDHLKDKIIGPRIIKAFEKLTEKKQKRDGLIVITCY